MGLKVVTLGCAACCLFITGCLSAPVENEVTWGIKAATGQLTETTPTEWQAVADQIDGFVPDAEISLTDAEAQAIVDFIQANDLDSIQEVVALVEQAQTDPSSVGDIEIPDSVMNLFGQDDFEEIANQLF
jgi:hypothetical protein